MNPTFWHRWCTSILGAVPIRPAAGRRSRRRSLVLSTLEDRVTPVLTPQMVLDVNADTHSSNPSAIVAIGSTTYFAADDSAHGVELWKSDGTATGTVLVKDLRPGTSHSYPGHPTAVNGTLFFAADNGASGRELWKSDGTAAGTVLVKDIVPGSAGSGPYSLTNVNGTLFFSAYSNEAGWELWKSDGTAAGTVVVRDTVPGFTGSYPRNLTNVNGTVFFTAQDATHGRELWKSDGTAAGTVFVKDLRPGAANSYPGELTGANGLLFFREYSETTGWELWTSDGTAAGTVVIRDINPGTGDSYPRFLTAGNGALYFQAFDGTHGNELWKSDGTTAGTVLVKDIYPGNSSSSPSGLSNVNGTLFLTAWEAGGTGLWKSDGTTAGTVRVGPVGGTAGNLTNVNGTLFFTDTDATTGTELWKSNGTAAGTVRVADIRPGVANSFPANMVDVSGTLFFAADDGEHGLELWKSDGTVTGTTLVKDIAPGGYVGSYGSYYFRGSSPANLTNVNGTLFFTTYTSGTGSQLWKSDGNAAGTVLVRQIDARNLTDVNGTLYFTASDANGAELWKSDGTAAGTVLVKDIYPGESYYSNPYGGGFWYPNSSSPGNLMNRNGTLFFTATDGEHGYELWKSDGTVAGTVLVKDIRPGPNSGAGDRPTNVNGTLYFTANDGTIGWELWKSDGTTAGTAPVKDIRPGASASYPESLTNVNGTLFLQANDGTTGRELWKSDGTAAGTVLVKDIRPGSGSSSPADESIAPRARAVVNGTLFFHANDGVHGRELWKSDGTAAGTTLVKDINLFTGPTSPFNLTSGNGILFFGYTDGTIWQSDGTEAGTVRIANLYSTMGNTLVSFNGTLFMSANDFVHGAELWKLVDDGTSLDVGGFPATVTAGVAGGFTVTAKNPDGSINTDYRRTVHFTSSDPQAVLPADYTFIAADQGVHTFTATLKTAGSQSITARDTTAPGLVGSQSGINVTPAAASGLTVAGFPPAVVAGVAGGFTVIARDPYGNRATGYTGTVRFTSSDPQAVLPDNYTFTPADAGARTFAATLKTAGAQSLSATDTTSATVSGTQSVAVSPAAASRFVLSAPAVVNANARFNLTVTVVDAYGNVATGYRGTIRFRSSDSSGRLPPNYTFSAADQGRHTFTGLVLKRRGIQTVTVTDTLVSALTATVSIEVR